MLCGMTRLLIMRHVSLLAELKETDVEHESACMATFFQRVGLRMGRWSEKAGIFLTKGGHVQGPAVFWSPVAWAWVTQGGARVLLTGTSSLISG